MKCVNMKPRDSKRISVYVAEWRGECRERVPRIEELVMSCGFTVKLIDVASKDLEDHKRVQHVRFVPHIEYLGLEISFEELGIFRGFGGPEVGEQV
jgi:hypothetical protein